MGGLCPPAEVHREQSDIIDLSELGAGAVETVLKSYSQVSSPSYMIPGHPGLQEGEKATGQGRDEWRRYSQLSMPWGSSHRRSWQRGQDSHIQQHRHSSCSAQKHDVPHMGKKW